MNYTNFTVDFIKRTYCNLNALKKQKSCETQTATIYEVTQLINSFLAFIVIPYEKHKKTQIEPLPTISNALLQEINNRVNDGYYSKEKDPPSGSYDNLIWHLRNAVAHGRIECHSDNRNIIDSIKFMDKREKGEKYSVEISIIQIERFVEEVHNSLN